ncbi:LysR substrate-binding domain-containing protein [Streptomyces sp. NPDC056161]|uniref:LysR substrate-binding domain-containing protein n=1 Tax=Streptomyces sp. NPDC056161 TaxID=3345732 RepID=UPI0035DF58E6
MQLDLRLMRYVVAVADEGGFQRAALRLHMAQPPLSRQIAELEQSMGVTFFERRPTRPTEAGRVFIEGARAILEDTDALIARTIRAQHGELGTVRVGYVLSAAYDTMPRLIQAVSETHPDLEVIAREGWGSALDDALRNGELDVVVSHTLSGGPEYRRQRLRRESFVAVVDVAHPFARRGSVALAEFAGQTFSFYSRDLAPVHYDKLMATLAETGRTFGFREDPVPGLRRIVLGDERSFTLVPASMADSLGPTTAALELTDVTAALDLDLVWRDSRTKPAVRAFLTAADRLSRSADWT